MGRWAEVYLASPPELREGAVLDLLRELKEQNSEPGSKGKTSPSPASEASAVRTNGLKASSTITAIEETAVQCSSCGRDNPVPHRFCGSCGAPLISETNSESPHATSARSAETNSETQSAPARENVIHETGIDEIRARLDPQVRKFEDSIAHPGELSLFRSFREKDSSDDDWEEQPPRRRLYLGAVLALLIAGAIYMAWRSGQLTAQRSQQAQSAPAATKDNSASPEPGQATDTQEPKPATPAAKTAITSPEKPEPLANASPAPVRNEQPIQPIKIQPINRISNVVSQTPAQTFIDNGGEELAQAQRYLTGANGRRDSSEAAKWLWRSISKHNGEATVMLADLYLKGDGVSKNCDQARVLLDTAGRKGVPGAGQRLRNLQAFGCQ